MEEFLDYFERMQMAAAGDASAREQIVELLRPRMVSMAGYYARRSHEDPDDLLQEAWMGVLDGLEQLDTRIGVPEQFLIQRARWRLLDSLKLSGRRSRAPLGDLDEDVCDGSNTADTALAAACVDEFVAALKPAQQQVLAYLLDGLTWREAGSRLGCSSANVAYHVRQIRRRYAQWSGEADEPRL